MIELKKICKEKLMNDIELVKALWRLAVLDDLKCLGCQYEHQCSLQECKIIREAAARLNELSDHPNEEKCPNRTRQGGK